MVLRNLCLLYVFAVALAMVCPAQDSQDLHPAQPNQPGQGIHSVPSFIQGLSDRRFDSVREDWSTPSLNTSSLKAVPVMIAFVNEEDGYSVSLIRLQWRRGDPIDLWLMKPLRVKNPPVILHIYGYPSDTEIFKDPEWQKFTTQGGFASVGFVTALTGHRYHDIPWKKWFLSELQQCLGESTHDVQMVMNYLASRSDLDMDRVGVVGQFSGASIGILASAVDPRIKVLDTLDPWGDWPTWMEKSNFPPKEERANYMTPEFLGTVAPLDTLKWIPKVQAKRFRLQQRHYDQQTPAMSKKKMEAAVPERATVAFYNNMNEFDTGVGPDGGKSLDWVKEQLRSLPEGAPVSAASATKPN